MKRIFISYRRDDTSDVTGRIFDKLKVEFGEDHLFRDIDSIPLGKDFWRVISDAVGRCDVLLAIIGDEWLDAAKADGSRRIDDPMDPVHTEIRAALDRGIPVIPVLVERTAIPNARDLPEPLRTLASRNGISVRPDPDFHHDMERLCAELGRGSRRRWPWVAAAGGALALALAVLGASIAFFGRDPAPDLRKAGPGPLELGALYFLGIGINEYRSEDVRERILGTTNGRLNFAVSDIQRLAETLTKYNPSSRVIEVMPLLLDGSATRERVVAAIGSLRRKLKSKDIGIVAYAGVELLQPESGTNPSAFYILPYDADLERPEETAISADIIFGALPNSRGQVVFWLDTCRSGRLARDMEDVNPAILTFASSAADEASIEVRSKGGGLFTTALVRGLQGEADSDKDGIVTLAELAPFASATTRSLAEGLGESQHPVISGDLPPLAVTAPGKRGE